MRFELHNEVTLFMVTIIFVVSRQSGGARSKTGGAVAPLLQRRTTTAPAPKNTLQICPSHDPTGPGQSGGREWGT